MTDISIDHDRCVRKMGIACKNCLLVCPTGALGVRDDLLMPVRPEACIACHCCKGSCPGGLDTIEIVPPDGISKPIVPHRADHHSSLAVTVGSLALKSPLILASGPVGRCARGWIAAAEAGFGAVVTKSVTLEPHGGNPAVRIWPDGRRSLINAEGLPNLGSEAAAAELAAVKEAFPGLVIIPSLAADTYEDFFAMAALFERSGADAFELALHGCPNVDARRVKRLRRWAEDPTATFDLVRKMKGKFGLPVWVKVNDNFDQARACWRAGADALVMKSRGPLALPLDPESGKPVLSHPSGLGVYTGPHSLWPGLNVTRQAAGLFDMPVIASGGIMAAQNVWDYLTVGADAVQLITAVIRRGLHSVPGILDDLYACLSDKNVSSVMDVRAATDHRSAIGRRGCTT
jgi:dihydroorotate dehydrogenase/NAD-dependent dihydropyrimidine dehydrogenase PreA subunit